MKKLAKDNSILDLLEDIELNSYTKQTLVSLFRSMIETIIESRNEALILLKINNHEGFESTINRLEFSGASVFSYSSETVSEKFNLIELKNNNFEKDEFLVIISDRFSSCLCWNNLQTDFCQGFCTLNPNIAKQIIDELQNISFNKNIEKELQLFRQDRRHNEKFTLIINKLLTAFDNQQRDFICINSELENFSSQDNFDGALSVLAHELRNPAGLISLYAKVIEKHTGNISQISPETADSLKTASASIKNAVSNIESIIAEIKDFAGAVNPVIENNDIHKTINEVINLIKLAFEEKLVTLTVSNTDKPAIISHDRFKIHQVILNLLKNALEASESGDHTMIKTKLAGNRFIINITDTGTGIAPENTEKIFMPYFSTKEKGSGIGLARSKKIIKAHGGDLVLSKTDKNGTTFNIILPC
jgi:signal transduction histidine kinase